MRSADLETLELPRLLEEVSRHAASSAGREACMALLPRHTVESAREELATVADMVAITEDEAAPLGDFPDIRPHLATSRTIGARLSGVELREVGQALSAVRIMRGFLRARGPGRPLLLRALGSLHALPELDRKLSDALDEEGGLRDDASPALRAVRRELRELRAQIETQLARMFRRSNTAHLFVEEYVTLRNGRFVVPVRAQSSSELPGIVQDRSASGETLFVEPLFAVEPNNRLLIAAREEAQEEDRILGEITAVVGEHAEALEEAFEALVELDTLVARAKFARKYRAICPTLGSEAIELRDARHPLLVLTGRTVTSIDVTLDADTRLLVITGPNTGGKSVALKTLGISVLMAQSGIPVLAADGASLPFFDAVWTDIGDRQSVAGDLSTFSGHIQNLGEILKSATATSLALLDEPGTGTDPEDGAALARVLLGELARRGTRVLATTHYRTLKVFALSEPGVAVASVDFDPETFAPLYRLVYGGVGPSLGLPVARRLGIPGDLLVAAERERGDEATSFANAVERLESERRRYEEGSAEIAAERDELGAARREHEALATELREKRRQKWADELGEASRFAAELRDQGRKLLAEARETPQRGREVEQMARSQASAIEERRREVLGVEEGASHAPQALAVGDDVEVEGSGVRGKLVSLAGDRAQITRGPVRFDVPAKRLRKTAAVPAPRPVARYEVPRQTVTTAVELGDAELNLVGARVRPALEQLEEFLDRAALDERRSVRIIHGHGTGALRNAVREYLAGSPYIERFEEADQRAGGSGATIAHLR